MVTLQRFRNRIVGHDEIDPGQLLANPRNWRIHPQAQQDALAGVLDEVGWVDEVLVNRRSGFVIDGHLRIALAISREEQSIPITYVDLSEEEEILILATLDPLAALAASDKDKLEELLLSVQSEDSRVQKMLNDLAQSEGIDLRGELPVDPGPQLDRAAELQQKWGTELGQIWELGDHRLAVGDCTDRAVVDALMMGERAKVMPADPPYGSDYYAGKNKGKYDSGKRSKKLAGDETPEGARDLMRDAFSIAPLIVPSAIFVFHDARYAHYLLDLSQDLGWTIRAHLVWVKPTAQISMVQQYRQQHEPFYYFVNGKNVEWYGGGMERTVFEISREADGNHPTVKPTELFERLIKNHSKNGDIIYDPFVGSGTTMIACENLDRRCRAIEIHPPYAAVAIQRWVDVSGCEPELNLTQGT